MRVGTCKYFEKFVLQIFVDFDFVLLEKLIRIIELDRPSHN